LNTSARDRRHSAASALLPFVPIGPFVFRDVSRMRSEIRRNKFSDREAAGSGKMRA
jgi:hypothetical protein